MNSTQRFIIFLESGSEKRSEAFEVLYADEVDFLDPMNRARTKAHLRKIEADLFKQLNEIQFTVLSHHGTQEESLVKWVMHYKFRVWKREITGVSHIKFNPEGCIYFQHDYWDASFPIYGEFPLMGLLMKGIKKMLAVKA